MLRRFVVAEKALNHTHRMLADFSRLRFGFRPKPADWPDGVHYGKPEGIAIGLAEIMEKYADAESEIAAELYSNFGDSAVSEFRLFWKIWHKFNFANQSVQIFQEIRRKHGGDTAGDRPDEDFAVIFGKPDDELEKFMKESLAKLKKTLAHQLER